MSQATRDLWPDQIDVTSIVPPIVILREQATVLGERTKGLVRAEVDSTEQPPKGIEEYLEDAIPAEARVVYVQTLYLVAPALDNYRYSLLSVSHDFQPYPCRVSFHPNPDRGLIDHFFGTMTIVSEGQFLQWLQVALNREETVRIIHGLISRVQQLGGANQ